MIVGFDHDDTRIFKAHYEFIRQTDIMHPTVNMLVAIPKTPLYARLKNDGRLDLSKTNPSDGMFGTNVIPLGMTRDELRDGYNGRCGTYTIPSSTSIGSKTSISGADSISHALAMPTGANIPGLNGNPSRSKRLQRLSCFFG